METENVHIRKWGNVGDGYLGPAFIRRFRKGQVLYGSRRTYLKKVAIADWGGVTANTTLVLEAIKGQMLQELLPWLMLSERFTKHSIKESKGSTNPYINYPDIAKFEFDLPPLDQQRRIAELCGAVDGIIARRENLFLSAMEQRKTWILEQIPVEIGTGKPRQLPNDEWQVLRIDNVARSVGGAGFPHRYQGKKRGDLPFYKVSDMNRPGNERVLTAAENYISRIEAKKLNASIIPSGAIVFPKVGAALFSNKRRITSCDCCIDNNVMAVVPQSLPTRYLYEFMMLVDFISFVHMGAVPSINQSHVNALQIPVPGKQAVASFEIEANAHDKILDEILRDVLNTRNVQREFMEVIFK